ncbi:OmpA family protein [Pseudomonas entomophila]|uniref:OmpA family protein n=1 Tax=Pseudomonas entomophila TaxID=312306 RepID=UPI001BCE7AC8|nr:OmpA family protein [Pseudomonas entomophila]QVM89638.1 OmpA family protein [Pseudomonas entomophila]
MSNKLLLPALSALALVIAGCAATPENPQLVEAREAFTTLQGKPESHRLAALETQQAQAALRRAEEASQVNRKALEVEELAYVANSRIDAANAKVRQRQAEAKLKRVEAERVKAQLDVRDAQLNALKARMVSKADKVEQTDRGTVVSFSDVLFATNKATLRNDSLDDIKSLAEFLRANPERKVRVEGFTDARGSESYNLALSRERAYAVAEKLRDFGVSSKRIVSEGYGKSFLLTHSTDERSHQRNRRVEIIVSNDANAVRAR